MLVNDHKINWSGAKVIDHEKRTRHRKVREALHITKAKLAMNKDQGVELSAFWKSIVGILVPCLTYV